MVTNNHLEERRTQKRFSVNGCMLITNTAHGGPIKDISRGGIAYYTADSGEISPEAIVSGTVTSDELRLDAMPLETITEFTEEKGKHTIKRYGVKFKDLTVDQVSQLDKFIIKFVDNETNNLLVPQ